MRFGKKLALMTEASARKGVERPFLSHRHLKDFLSAITRELKNDPSGVASHVAGFKETLLSDLKTIREFMRSSEDSVHRDVAELVQQTQYIGIGNDAVTSKLIECIHLVFVSPCEELHDCVGEHLKAAWLAIAERVARIADSYNRVASTLQSLVSYADMNIAGFRKLIKQYTKQVPQPHYVHIIDVSDYLIILGGLLLLVSETNSLRDRIQEVICRLSPGVQELHRVTVGKEILLAAAGCLGEPIADRSTLLRDYASPVVINSAGANLASSACGVTPTYPPASYS